MITALILIYTALIFALGVIIGRPPKRGEVLINKPKVKTELNDELANFLSYDGTEQ